jgi:hypothetical protein
MVLTKEEIWGRLQTDSRWITSIDRTAPTNFFAAAVAERQFRYIVAIWISGNMNVTTNIEFYKVEEDATLTTKWSPIPVAPADFRQIPEGSYSVEDPVLTLEGGTNVAANVDVRGLSLNVSMTYWDWDI